MAYAQIEVAPLSGALGADVRGIDLSKPLAEPVWQKLHRAFLEYGVIAIRGQTLSHAEQIAFARRFGPLDVHPIANGLEEFPEVIRVLKPAGESASFGVSWHTDNSFFSEPSLASVLYGVIIPPYGGDTLYASMQRAYDALSLRMQQLLDDLVAVHSASRAYDPATTGVEKYEGKTAITYRYGDAIFEEVEHPLIRTHPETGRKSIYVNPMFTQRIVDLQERESDALLDFLYRHCARPEHTCRLRWQPGTVAVWDNRCVQHYALDDYQDFERLMYRVTIQGDKPR